MLLLHAGIWAATHSWVQSRLATTALGTALLLGLATAAANVWGVHALNERLLPQVQAAAAAALGRDLDLGRVRWLAPTGLAGLTPVASMGPVSVGPAAHEHSSARLERVELGLDVAQSLLQQRLVLAARARGAELHAVQADNYSWFGYPDDTTPSARDFLPGLRPPGASGGGGSGSVGGADLPPPAAASSSGSSVAAAAAAADAGDGSALRALDSILQELVRQAAMEPSQLLAGSGEGRRPQLVLMGLGGRDGSCSGSKQAVTAAQHDLALAPASADGNGSSNSCVPGSQASGGPGAPAATAAAAGEAAEEEDAITERRASHHTASTSTSSSGSDSFPHWAVLGRMQLPMQVQDALQAARSSLVKLRAAAQPAQDAASNNVIASQQAEQGSHMGEAAATASVVEAAGQQGLQREASWGQGWRDGRRPEADASGGGAGAVVPGGGSRPPRRSAAKHLSEQLRPVSAPARRLYRAPQRWTVGPQLQQQQHVAGPPSLQQLAARTATAAAAESEPAAIPPAPQEEAHAVEKVAIVATEPARLPLGDAARDQAPAAAAAAEADNKPLSRGAQLINALPGVQAKWVLPGGEAAGRAAETPAEAPADRPLSEAAQRINAIGVLRLHPEQALRACIDQAGIAAFHRVVVDPSTQHKKGGSASLPWAAHRPPVRTLIGSRLSPSAAPEAAPVAAPADKPAAAAQEASGEVEAADDAAALADEAEAAAEAGEKAKKERGHLLHPGYFTATDGPTYTPAPPEALIDARASALPLCWPRWFHGSKLQAAHAPLLLLAASLDAIDAGRHPAPPPPCRAGYRRGTAQALLRQALDMLLSGVKVPQVALGSIGLEGATLLAHIHGEAVPRRFDDVSMVSWRVGWGRGTGLLQLPGLAAAAAF